uniref:Uncharacterized protein LOC107413661 n=1 Tax=Rhizophora mucronata TaxID=61149 RepID=A0A2P2J6V7_RHIMU
MLARLKITIIAPLLHAVLLTSVALSSEYQSKQLWRHEIQSFL